MNLIKKTPQAVIDRWCKANWQRTAMGLKPENLDRFLAKESARKTINKRLKKNTL